jgi:hypothetical protein
VSERVAHLRHLLIIRVRRAGLFRNLLLFCAVIGTSVALAAHHVPSQYQSIAAAVAAADDGDTVIVAPGKYEENILIENKCVHLVSNFVLDSNWQTVRETILDGSNPGDQNHASVLEIYGSPSEPSSIVGFTITGGLGTFLGSRYAGGGVLIAGGAQTVVSCNIITGNSATRGGAIAIYQSAPIIVRNVVSDNNSARGAGLDLESSAAIVSHNIVGSNSASIEGGGVRAVDCPLTQVKDNIICQNTAPTIGGLLFDDPLMTVEHNNFWLNTNGHVGGCETQIGDSTCCVNYNWIPCDSSFNVFRDPSFVDFEHGDYSTTCSSAAVDGGSGINEDPLLGGIRDDIGIFEYLYLVGDITSDSAIDIDDLIRTIGYVYGMSDRPCPLHSADWNCDGKVDILDISRLINYIFKGGPPQCT